mmetsp:Transcript_28578/g.32066  ORF Transcript_28578/g.32066 Transcript_28578/m.32066 type:complete len:91 (-) Transcript_28578:107-379(-)
MTTMMMSRMTIELEELALFIIELSVHDYYFLMNTNKSSVISLAASLNVAQLLIDFSSSTPASSMMLMRMLMIHDQIGMRNLHTLSRRRVI